MANLYPIYLIRKRIEIVYIKKERKGSGMETRSKIWIRRKEDENVSKIWLPKFNGFILLMLEISILKKIKYLFDIFFFFKYFNFFINI